MNSSRLISRLLSRSGVRTPVRTQRLLLRSPEARDVPEIARLAGDWEVASMTARIPYPYTVEDARRWLAGLAPGEVVLVVEHAGQLVGATGYVPSDDGTSAEIGYWIGKPFWGRGFATEAARALIDLAFRDRRIGTLVCCHFADNPASARVIEKMGFVRTRSCKAWSDARRLDAPSEHYELKRPVLFSWLRRGAA